MVAHFKPQHNAKNGTKAQVHRAHIKLENNHFTAMFERDSINPERVQRHDEGVTAHREEANRGDEESESTRLFKRFEGALKRTRKVIAYDFEAAVVEDGISAEVKARARVLQIEKRSRFKDHESLTAYETAQFKNCDAELISSTVFVSYAAGLAWYADAFDGDRPEGCERYLDTKKRVLLYISWWGPNATYLEHWLILSILEH